MELQIRPLTSNDDRNTFDCGNSSLNDWLRRTAKQHQEKDLSRTYVAIWAGDSKRIAGYYALSATLIQTEGMQDQKLPREVSAVLLGRLAVDEKDQGQSLGEYLLMHALEAALKTADIIGVRCVVVDAIDDPAVRFYQKYGFVSFTTQPMRLVLALDTVRQLLA
ncbi:GNAT family N-acetyltransferase [Ralstonia nicotianae]|uniref:Putative n-acetyltransferase protein n=1 Tax=Ralstonia solanacearum TaxID=305 RepID=A0A0S4UGH4_RALSL|nr:GNAT family N-acetyltransferase [Ralstonia pseudosolanacearum]KAF3458260.1 N-acetyltransferase [Ralstonia solanacearum]MCK4125880.1 GNAT family N-acetyltransferase [Ralstonia pseudosolanacearum]MCK4130692.1 GNAT family N-acetyltransferase [Ralstonia pseudosolanacearum]NKA06661.1 N-acetyltransferase [Ralstonia solanacearum]NKA56243.1 N-acetyltransferase [Ralstonia solanacearum]